MTTTATATKKGQLIGVMGKNPIKYKNGYVTPARIITKDERIVFDAIYNYNKYHEFDFDVYTIIEQLNYRNNQDGDVLILKNIVKEFLENCLSEK